GVVLICPSDVADARMRMFNLDGSEGKMCGNAIRCVGKYLYDKGLVNKEKLTIDTLSGIKTLTLHKFDGKVKEATVDMGKAELEPKKIPVLYDGERAIDRPITVGGKEYRVTCVSMGNPHAVVFCDNPDTLDLDAIGPMFENHEKFPERINTEFIRVIDDHTLKMRVWERGSGETWACGTGACAAVVAAVENGYCKKGEDVTVKLKGGNLVIRYTDDAVFMTGNAEIAFEGVVEI
ncbi:MAG: diaminopimelate epimerase, partial [Acutalibacteraceae bacterium]